MFNNKKEYILCAAYLFKEGYATPNVERMNKQIEAERKEDDLRDIRDIYYQPHRQVFDMALGWRHCDILYKYGDCIQKENGGGFMTSRGRYVDRMEAAKIALECGQITNKDTKILYSEDIY